MRKDLKYKKKLVKQGKEVYWQVIEYPKKVVVAEYFFEEDASRMVKFQNEIIAEANKLSWTEKQPASAAAQRQMLKG